MKRGYRRSGRLQDAPGGGKNAPPPKASAKKRLVGDYRYDEPLDLPGWEWACPVPAPAGEGAYAVGLEAWRVNVVRDWTGGAAALSVALPAGDGAPAKLDFVLDCSDSREAPAVSWPDGCSGARRTGHGEAGARENLEAVAGAVAVYRLDEYLPGAWIVRRYVARGAAAGGSD